jgi:hypothetical protein
VARRAGEEGASSEAKEEALMYYNKKHRLMVADLVSSCQLLTSYVGHHGHVERNHPVLERMREDCMTLALREMHVERSATAKKAKKEAMTAKLAASLARVTKQRKKRRGDLYEH